MSLDSFNNRSAPLFLQGAPALARLSFYALICVLLMVMDVRFHLTAPLRYTMNMLLLPIEKATQMPFEAFAYVSNQIRSVNSLTQENESLKKQVLELREVAQREKTLLLENQQLAQLNRYALTVDVRKQIGIILREVSNPFARKAIINVGAVHSVQLGSPVLDASGVVGQVTRVYQLHSEVTLLTDKNAATPVQSERTGFRMIAYGDANAQTGGVEIRYLATNADIQVKDLLVTSGLDGIYPRGLAVGTVTSVDRQTDATFAHVQVTPASQVERSRYVLVLDPQPQITLPASQPVLPDNKKAKKK